MSKTRLANDLPPEFMLASTEFNVLPDDVGRDLLTAYEALSGIRDMMNSAATPLHSPDITIKPGNLASLLEIALERMQPAVSQCKPMAMLFDARPDLLARYASKR